jgi:hypothetical protein
VGEDAVKLVLATRKRSAATREESESEKEGSPPPSFLPPSQKTNGPSASASSATRSGLVRASSPAHPRPGKRIRTSSLLHKKLNNISDVLDYNASTEEERDEDQQEDYSPLDDGSGEERDQAEEELERDDVLGQPEVGDSSSKKGKNVMEDQEVSEGRSLRQPTNVARAGGS